VRLARFASLAACAASLALGLGACGQKSYPDAADANNDGGYVQAGPITYQMQISRELNPYDVEDKGYLVGVSAPPPTATQEWYGVFLWAKNQGDKPATTTDSFTIVDTQGRIYYPVPIDAAVNPYAWTAQTLQPLGVQPVPNSTAYFGPTQGQLVLFKIDSSAYSNRPLTLQIHAPGEPKPSTISLDL
jgi:hypothetical protein